MPRSRARAGWLTDGRSESSGYLLLLMMRPCLRGVGSWPQSHILRPTWRHLNWQCAWRTSADVWHHSYQHSPWYNSYRRCFSALARRHLYHLWCPPLLQRVVCSRRLTMSTRSPRCSGSSRRPPSVYRTPSFFLVAPAAHERLFGAVTKL